MCLNIFFSKEYTWKWCKKKPIKDVEEEDVNDDDDQAVLISITNKLKEKSKPIPIPGKRNKRSRKKEQIKEDPILQTSSAQVTDL